MDDRHEAPSASDGNEYGKTLDRCTTEQMEDYMRLRSAPIPYAGRLGGNQEFVLDPTNPATKDLLHKVPDAAPWMSYRDVWALGGFKEPSLWKPALIEGVGTMMLCFVSIMLNVSPALNIQAPPNPTGSSGIFGTVEFLGPLVGSVTNIMLIALFIFSFGAVTGGHLNPMITIATFLCRLTTFPRAILYVGFQLAGATLGGLLVRASLNRTDWKVGGCFYDPNLVTSGQMFTMEFSSSLTLIFLAFGVGLDPRQAQVFGPALAPILVAVALGLLTLATAFNVPGYGGAGMNPGRCFAVWVGSGHSLGVTGVSDTLGYNGSNGSRLWIYWVAPTVAGILHAILYQLVPPWSFSGTGNLEVKKLTKIVGGKPVDANSV